MKKSMKILISFLGAAIIIVIIAIVAVTFGKISIPSRNTLAYWGDNKLFEITKNKVGDKYEYTLVRNDGYPLGGSPVISYCDEGKYVYVVEQKDYVVLNSETGDAICTSYRLLLPEELRGTFFTQNGYTVLKDNMYENQNDGGLYTSEYLFYSAPSEKFDLDAFIKQHNFVNKKPMDFKVENLSAETIANSIPKDYYKDCLEITYDDVKKCWKIDTSGYYNGRGKGNWNILVVEPDGSVTEYRDMGK